MIHYIQKKKWSSSSENGLHIINGRDDGVGGMRERVPDLEGGNNEGDRAHVAARHGSIHPDVDYLS